MEGKSYPSLDLAGIDFEDADEHDRIEVLIRVDIDNGTGKLGGNSERLHVFMVKDNDLDQILDKAFGHLEKQFKALSALAERAASGFKSSAAV